MKRRRVLQTLLASPAAAAAAQSTPAPAAVAETAPLVMSSAETGAAGLRTFFSKEQFSALRKLADLVLPAYNGRPAASQTGTPEFLDFFVRECPKDIQKLWTEGLQRLHDENFNESLLNPLKESWTYHGPPEPFARFLQQAKLDILQAAANSREWAEAAGRGRRASAPSGYFWRSAD